MKHIIAPLVSVRAVNFIRLYQPLLALRRLRPDWAINFFNPARDNLGYMIERAAEIGAPITHYFDASPGGAYANMVIKFFPVIISPVG